VGPGWSLRRSTARCFLVDGVGPRAGRGVDRSPGRDDDRSASITHVGVSGRAYGRPGPEGRYVPEQRRHDGRRRLNCNVELTNANSARAAVVFTLRRAVNRVR